MRDGVRRSAALALAVLCGAATGCSSDGPVYERYVAIGDSYTAGPSIPDSETDNGCSRSTNSYPDQVARSLRVTELVDVACGGATTANATVPQRNSYGHNIAQLTAVDDDADLVTVSLGANDERLFGRLVNSCAAAGRRTQAGSPCAAANTVGGHDVLTASAARTRGRLAQLLRAVRAKAPHARVLAVGYPQLARAGESCPQRVPWAPGDHAYVASVIDALNAAVRGAAADVGVEYVDVAALSTGHVVCDPQPWVAGQRTVPQQAAAAHPYLREQTAVARAVVERAAQQGG